MSISGRTTRVVENVTMRYATHLCPPFQLLFVNISMSLPAQSSGQQEEGEEEEVTHPLYVALVLLNQVWLGWPVATRPGQARMDSPMSEVPGTQTTVSRETHRACLRRSLLSRSDPTESHSYVTLFRGQNRVGSLYLALLDPGTKLFNFTLIFPWYSKVDTK